MGENDERCGRQRELGTRSVLRPPWFELPEDVTAARGDSQAGPPRNILSASDGELEECSHSLVLVRLT